MINDEVNNQDDPQSGGLHPPLEALSAAQHPKAEHTDRTTWLPHHHAHHGEMVAELVAAASIPQLVGLLGAGSEAAVQVAAAEALTNLASGSGGSD